MNGVKVKAYAKINLIIDVLKKREDGYHEVEMIMQAISLHDLVAIKSNVGIAITSNHPSVPLNEKNLAYQAADLLMKKYPNIPGAEINIEKRIPVEAGLAGGSTDAAAVILGMNEIYNLNMDKADMLRLGGLIGSDVPFCISGATALASGRGEKIEEVTTCPMLWVVLVKPPFGVKTAEVYGNLNLNEVDGHPDVRGYLNALATSEVSYLLKNIHNVLEYSTFRLYPKLQVLKEKLKSMGANSILMSGSGPTIFALFTSEVEAQALADTIEEELNYQVLVANTLNRQVLNERVEIL